MAALCTRRSGKTRTVGAMVTGRSLTRRTQTLLFAPTEDQSKELLQYVREMNDALGCPVPLVRESQTELAWANGSRVLAKTDRPKSARGFTPDLLVIDEAAQISDELYLSIKPMLILGKCDLLALTTPFGKVGWFFNLWDDEKQSRYWRKWKITAYECPRIRRDVLAEHAATMPPRWFNQEYMCEFNDAVDAVFGKTVIDAAERDIDLFAPLELTA
ncbi:MAG TPA: terminase family protein [Urbifossiella sp.]|nr:terminase family protein [Urbifossiella sp.]